MSRPMAGSLVERARTVVASVRSKNLETWVGGYARWLAASAVPRARAALGGAADGPRHLLFAFCDHYEPLWSDADDGARRRARARLAARATRRWPTSSATPTAARRATPSSSPASSTAPTYLDALARAGAARASARSRCTCTTTATPPRGCARQLGELPGRCSRSTGTSRATPTGACATRSSTATGASPTRRRDGRWCGVDEELPLLFDTGCYADFTFPSAPDECQPTIVNRIYWPDGRPRAAARLRGRDARRGSASARDDRILMIEGPLALGAAPAAGCSRCASRTPRSRPTIRRRRRGSARWVRAGHPRRRGGRSGSSSRCTPTARRRSRPRRCSATGDGSCTASSTTRYNDGKRWRLHYVTAREMYNIAIAAMDGRTGNPDSYRDYVLPPPPVAAA